MTQRAAIVQEALTWEGTKYHPHACLKGVGVDCVMLLCGVAKAVGLLAPDWQPPYYSQEWHCHQREERLVATLHALGCQALPSPAVAQAGDIVAFRLTTLHTRLPISHVGILLPAPYFLHAHAGHAVQRIRLAARWQRELAAAFTFPGVTL